MREFVQGTGKTTGAVATAYEDSIETKRLIYSNAHLNCEQYRHFDTSVFLEKILGEELEDVILVTDEMYQMADSRSSQTKLNKLWTYFVVQTRKRGVDLYLCTHNLDHVDIRIRRAVDIRGTCRAYEEKPCRKCKCRKCGGTGRYNGDTCPECEGRGGTGEVKGKPCDNCHGYGKRTIIRIWFLDRRMKTRYSVDILGNDYWHLFDTRERIPINARIFQGIDTTEYI